MDHACDICGELFRGEVNLNKHKAHKHKIFARHTFSCAYCKYKTIKKANWRRHLAGVHKLDEVRKKVEQVFCECCSFGCMNYKELAEHYSTEHGLPAELKAYLFETFDDFQKWKNDLQLETGSLFNCRSTGLPNKLGNTHYYYRCDKAGRFSSAAKGSVEKPAKVGISKKVVLTCPAFMNAIIRRCGQVYVVSCQCHFSHNKLGAKQLSNSASVCDPKLEPLDDCIDSMDIVPNLGQTNSTGTAVAYAVNKLELINDIVPVDTVYDIVKLKAEIFDEFNRIENFVSSSADSHGLKHLLESLKSLPRVTSARNDQIVLKEEEWNLLLNVDNE